MQRLECLDGLRGGLAVYVMISHMAPFAALPGWMTHPLSHGGAAVDIFFILSGLVIVGSLERCRHRAIPFLRARIARIHPLYLVVLALAIAVHPLHPPITAMGWLSPDSLAARMWTGGTPHSWPIDLLAHLTMTHGLFPDGILPHVWVSILGAAWSLSTEWQFYILALLAGGWLTRRGAPDWALAWLLVAIGAAGTAWTALAPAEWQFSRAFLGNKAAYFALGVMSARVVHGQAHKLAQYAAVLAATLVLAAAQGGAGKLAAPLLWTVILAAQHAPRGALRPLATFLCTPPMQTLGLLSYAIYLVNEPVQRALGWALLRLCGGDAATFTLLWLPGAIGLPILAAIALNRWVERPGQRWVLGRRPGAGRITRSAERQTA